MANSNLAIRFSEEIYASRSEVARELRTNLVDGIWNNIVTYRSSFVSNLDIYDVSKNAYYMVNTSLIVRKNNDLAIKLSRLLSKTSAWINNKIERITVSNEMKKAELIAVAKSLNIIINDVAVDNIINHRPVDRMYAPVSNYYDALEYLEKNSMDDINEDTIATYYGILNGENELLSFYREGEYNSTARSAARAVINKEYSGVPSMAIESLMDDLIDFINNSNASSPVKLSAIFYMMDYIKPFEKYNELMAIILIKLMLAKFDIDRHASIVPIELLLVDEHERVKAMLREVQKTRDITYINNLTNDLVSKEIQLVLDAIARSQVDEARDAFYGVDEKEAIEEELGIKLEEKPYEKEEEEIKPEPVREIKFERIVPREEPVKVQPKPREAKELKVDEEAPKINYVNIAKPSDEKSLNRLEEDLLESDPLLRPAQAHFYVRHCTLGKFYTIQQFKKAEGCVYETARTSMDNLAKRGYYKREQVKNKFVYTPIKRD